MRQLLKGCVPEGTQDKFEKYYNYLIEKNAVMNLTAITDKADAATLHFLDSLALLEGFELEGRSVIDVGTGAGFPGLPIKIACPSISLTLLDGLNKRVEFLKETCALLQVQAVCVHGRAEEFGVKNREGFDVAVSRAVAALPMLAELCIPLVRVGGLFLAMKSFDSSQEIADSERAIGLLGGRLLQDYVYTIPKTDIKRRVAVIEKLSPTPEKYPRKFARIKAAPL